MGEAKNAGGGDSYSPRQKVNQVRFEIRGDKSRIGPTAPAQGGKCEY